MRKILAYGTFALLIAAPFAVPAHAQTIWQSMVRPGVLANGVDGITPSGETVPGGDAEAQQASGDANIGKHIFVEPQAMSGGSGMTESYGSVPYAIDPHSPYDNSSVFALPY